MSEDWDFYQLLVDSEPASIFVDLGLRTQAPISGYGDMGYLRIKMQAPRPDGLPSNEEFERLSEIEDHITGKLSSVDHTIFVGRNSSSGNRDLYFYTNNPDAFESMTTEAINSFSGYRFETATRPDAAWDTYFGFLYPSPPDYQKMMNRRVFTQLQQHGDVTSAPRKIDHVALFDNKTAADQFVDYLKSEGFEITKIHKQGLFSKKRDIEFFRADTPDNIDTVVVPIFQKLIELGGTYDGWGCPIVSPNDT